MIYVGEPHETPPATFHTPLQKAVYAALSELGIPFVRVDTGEAITMEDCADINQRLGVQIVKTLFLCNRQQTDFYLFITRGDKPFSSKAFSHALEVPRVSFASEERMQVMLGTRVGAATVFSALLDTENRVRVVLDREVLREAWYGCSDGTTTGYMKLQTERLVGDFLPFAKHDPAVIEV